jgi:hypothetical protein
MPNKNQVITKELIEAEQLTGYKYYSISRLDTYRTCPMLYYNKYVKKIPVKSESKSTMVGSIVHNVLETYYSPENIQVKNTKVNINRTLKDIYEEALVTTLIQKKFLPEQGFDSYLGKLLKEYLDGLKILLHKSSAEYTGKDAIRKGDKGVASKPEMTGDWRRMSDSMGLETKRITLNNLFFQLSELDISVPEVCITAEKILGNYKDPIIPLLKQGYKVKYLEIPLSEIQKEGEDTFYLVNGVLLPEGLGREEGIYLRGYIDIVLEDKNGNLIIIDHKTSASAFNDAHVQYNAQTIAYAWALRQILDQPIIGVGINNIREGSLNISYLNNEVELLDIVENTFMCHKLIKTNVFPKHMPSSNYSKCLDSYGEPCPYLNICWNNNTFNK